MPSVCAVRLMFQRMRSSSRSSTAHSASRSAAEDELSPADSATAADSALTGTRGADRGSVSRISYGKFDARITPSRHRAEAVHNTFLSYRILPGHEYYM